MDFTVVDESKRRGNLEPNNDQKDIRFMTTIFTEISLTKKKKNQTQ